MISEETSRQIASNSRASGRKVGELDTTSSSTSLPLCGKDPWRYGMLLAYCLINITNSFLWISFSTVVDSAKAYYDIKAQDVDTISIIYQYCYIAAFWFPAILFPRTGLKYGLFIGGLLNVMCAVMRLLSVYAIPKCYPFLVVGNVFGGICQVIVLAAPPMISGLWFPPEERNRATAVGAASVFMGPALGLLAPTWLVNSNHQGADDFAAFHWMSLGLTVVTVLAILPVPKAPCVPPSLAAQVTSVEKKQNSRNPTINDPDQLLTTKLNDDNDINHDRQGGDEEEESTAVADTLKLCVALLKNKNFILTNVVCCTFIGITWELPALFAQIIKPFGLSSNTAGWAGFIAEIAGMSGAIAAGCAANWIQDSKKSLLGLGIAIAAPILMMLLAFSFGFSTITSLGASVVTICGWLFINASASAAFPLLYELAVEVTFPVKEEVTGPILMWTTSVCSLILVKVFGAIIGDDPTKMDACIVLAGNCIVVAIGVLAASFLTPIYLRREYEKATIHQQQHQV